jgi:hypothetical protein
MVINQLYAQYFQKSKLFLYPLLGFERGLTAPEEVYFSWEGKYAPEDQKLIVVYSNASDPDFQVLKSTKLSKHRLLKEIIPTMQDQEIYVFDFSSGVIPKYSHISNGVCFKCNGRVKIQKVSAAHASLR